MECSDTIACHAQNSAAGSHEDHIGRCSLRAYASEEGAPHELLMWLFRGEYVHDSDTAQGALLVEQMGNFPLIVVKQCHISRNCLLCSLSPLPRDAGANCYSPDSKKAQDCDVQL